MKIAVVLVLMVAGLLLVGLARSEWKLVVAIMVATSATFGDMTILELTGFYKHSTVGTYCAGTGLAGVLANLYYLGELYQSVNIYWIKPVISLAVGDQVQEIQRRIKYVATFLG